MIIDPGLDKTLTPVLFRVTMPPPLCARLIMNNRIMETENKQFIDII